MDTKGLKIIFAGGCFWGLQKLMDGLPGVLETRAGYANGKEAADAHYERVCGGETGFKEAVEVIYNPLEIALDTLLSVFFQVIDPTVADRQGNDVGHQYQTGIYYIDAAQKAVVERAASMVAAGGEPFMVEIGPLENFYPAEEYHQHYLDKNPGGYCHISLEKMAKARDFAASLNHFVRPSEETLRHTLNEMQYAVTQEDGTEPPFSSPLWDADKPGIYVDVVTGEPLFSSKDKFLSTCGWPSFSAPIAQSGVTEQRDNRYGMDRTEVRSRRGDSHLGHVFRGSAEGPQGVRYCINGAALRFIPLDKMVEAGYGDLVDAVT